MPLIFVGELQDNFQVPFETKAGTATAVAMYVTELGALDNPLQIGFPASANPLSNAKAVPMVPVGGAMPWRRSPA